MNNTKLIGLILAVLLLLSLSAFAMADNIGPGGTLETNNEQIGTNEGTVTNNYGTVTNNCGTVDYNGTAADHENAKIKNNYGTVDYNYGTVNTNGSFGNVSVNLGTVEENNGCISYNGCDSNPGKDISINDIHGTVSKNNGTISHNYGTVKNNEGTVGVNHSIVAKNGEEEVTVYGEVLNNTGEVDSNFGIVRNGAGGNVNNNYYIVYDSNDVEYVGVYVGNTNGVGGTQGEPLSVEKDSDIELDQEFKSDGSTLTGYTTVDPNGSNNYTVINSFTYKASAPSQIWLIWEKTPDDPVPQPGPSGGGSGSSGSETYVVVMPHTLEPSADMLGLVLRCNTVGGFGEADVTGALTVLVDFKAIDESCYTAVLNEKGNIEISFTDEFLATLSGGVHMASVIINNLTYTSQIKIPFV